MIIKAKPAPLFFLKIGGFLLEKLLRRRFNKLVIDPVDIHPGHSYVVMCNHFSFWDGFLAFYVSYKLMLKNGMMKRVYIMSLKKQMEMKWWLKYCGSFSVEPGKLSIRESFEYAAEMLSQPGNVLLFFPQGILESMHVRDIELKEGIAEIVPRITGDCQLIWTSNIIEYFESIKPSVYFNTLDCGTNHNFDFEELKRTVNRHHNKAMQQNIRSVKH